MPLLDYYCYLSTITITILLVANKTRRLLPGPIRGHADSMGYHKSNMIVMAYLVWMAIYVCYV